MNYIKRNILLLLILFFGLLTFFLTSTTGLLSLVKLANILLPGSLKVCHLEGSLIRDIRFDKLDYTTNAISIRLNQGRVIWSIQSWRHPHIKLTQLHFDKVVVAFKNQATTPFTKSITSGSYHVPIAMNLEIKSFTINQLQVNSFLVDTVQAQAVIDQEHWVVHQFHANYKKTHVSLRAHGQFYKTYPLSLSLHIAPIKPNTHGEQGTVTLTGDTSLYRWRGTFSGSIPIELKGTLQNINKNPLLDSKIIWGENTVTITGTPPHQLQLNASIPQPQTLHSSLLGLQTHIEAKGSINNKEGSLTVTIAPGIYTVPNNQHVSTVPFQGGHLLISLASGDVLAKGLFTLDPDKLIDFAFKLPNVQVKNITSLTQMIDGKIHLQVSSLNFLNDLSKEIEHLSGQLTASITVKGSMQTPIIDGNAALSNAKLFIPELGLTMDPIQAVVTSHNKEWEAHGSIRALNKVMEIKGQGDFSPQLIGVVNIISDSFPLLRTDDYLVDISPQLTIHFKPESYDITGTVLVPTVQLKLASFTKTVNLPDDTVFVQKETVTTPISSNRHVDVVIKMGSDVAVNVQGLRGFLDGSIQIKQEPNSEVSALGELTVREGTYKAYDQDLTIESGKLIFSGGALNNPNLSLRAVRQFNNTSSFTGSNQLFDFNDTNLQAMDFNNHLTVGVEVRGHLNSPKLTLFSIPATLSQADIISMLLLGKPSNQASQSGGQILLMAISSMNLDSGTKGKQLLSELKESLGLDFNVQSGSQFNQKTNQTSENTSVVIGKSLSKRLYLSYNMGLFQNDSSVLILKYLLNKYLSLQVSASDTGDGIDLLYTTHP